jgi:gamma-glutamylcyclotransferase (GGCT)/AIG2-like uncharacterized protein YtfP
MKNYIYAAYGSNLNHAQMAVRCPKAVFVGIGKIKNHRLVFRGVADIESDRGSEVLVGLWRITEACLKALDRYEGWPSLYERDTFMVHKQKGSPVPAIAYYMNSIDYGSPTHGYYKSIADGYKDCGLQLDALEDALMLTQEICDQFNSYN